MIVRRCILVATTVAAAAHAGCAAPKKDCTPQDTYPVAVAYVVDDSSGDLICSATVTAANAFSSYAFASCQYDASCAYCLGTGLGHYSLSVTAPGFTASQGTVDIVADSCGNVDVTATATVRLVPQ